MPKLLQVTTAAASLNAFLLPYAEHFRANGWRVDALAREARACEACRAGFDRVWDVNWSRRPGEIHRWRALVRDIRDLVETQQYDLVHVHTPIAAFITRFALRNLRHRLGTAVIYTAHGFHFHQGGRLLHNGLFRLLEQWAGRWTDYLIVINRDDEAEAQRLRLVPAERVRYMPGIGVDTERLSPEQVDPAMVDAVRAELGIPPAAALLLMIAEFNPGKRHADALAAFSKVNRRDAHLAFAGEGPLRPAMQQLAAQLGIRERTHFLGFRRDIPALIRASRATVLPSEREGLPRSIMESLSLGVPVIGTDIRGVRELIDPSCGITFETGDVAAMARAMEAMLDQSERAAAMGCAGREKMQAFDIRRVLALHEALYDEALNRA